MIIHKYIPLHSFKSFQPFSQVLEWIILFLRVIVFDHKSGASQGHHIFLHLIGGWVPKAHLAGPFWFCLLIYCTPFSSSVLTFTSLTLPPQTHETFLIPSSTCPRWLGGSSTYPIGIFSFSFILFTNPTALTATTSSILGMVIFSRGTIWVLPVPSLHSTSSFSLSQFR